MRLMSEIELEKIEAAVTSEKPQFVVIDSIQTLFSSALESAPGSVTQVRECSARLTRLAKATARRSSSWVMSPRTVRLQAPACLSTSSIPFVL